MTTAKSAHVLVVTIVEFREALTAHLSVMKKTGHYLNVLEPQQCRRF